MPHYLPSKWHVLILATFNKGNKYSKSGCGFKIVPENNDNDTILTISKAYGGHLSESLRETSL